MKKLISAVAIFILSMLGMAIFGMLFWFVIFWMGFKQ